MPLLRRIKAAAVSVAAFATTLVMPAHVAAAPIEDVAPNCLGAGPELRYVVLFDNGLGAADAAARVSSACGSLTMFHQEIAVGVATSSDSRFLARIGRARAFSAESTVGRGKSTSAPLSTAGALSSGDRTAEQWNMDMIRAPRARALESGAATVLVGVLDSGIDANHPDLTGALDPARSAGCLTGKADRQPSAWQPTTSTHGTHVAGIIAAADDGKGIAGVAPGVRVASVKVVDDRGYVFPEAVVCGLMWAAENDMTITNNSYFVDPWLLTCDRPGEYVVYEAVRRAVDYASRRGVLTVAAATNENVDLADPRGQTAGAQGDRRALDSSCKLLPGGLRGVVTVSALRQDRLKAGYSAYGLGVVDVTAPGGEQTGDGCVLSTVPNGYGELCGTSMATPHATGIAALLASKYPGAGPQQLARLLNNTAQPVACPDDYDLDRSGGQDAYCSGYEPYNSFYGHGLVDALAAVQA